MSGPAEPAPARSRTFARKSSAAAPKATPKPMPNCNAKLSVAEALPSSASSTWPRPAIMPL